MIITKKAISRRTLLRGLGATIALPLLDAMVPALAGSGRTAATPALRFSTLYVPNGVIPGRWFPETEGAAFEWTPILQPLEPFRDRLLVLSGLDSMPPTPPDVPDVPHGRASTKFLTSVHPHRGLRADTSIDQIVARAQETRLPSLEIAIESVDSGATCDRASCVYTGTISWAGPTMPLSMENNPRRVFERLFGDSETTDPALRRALVRRQGSILDAVLADFDNLRRNIGPEDRSRLTAYLDSVRDVERRTQIASQEDVELPQVVRPEGIPATYEEHVKLMFDLKVLAYQADITRVTTFMYGRELSGRTFPEIGVPDAHHPVSHHRNNPRLMDKCMKINIFQTTLFRYFLEKLEAEPDGDGTLLDNTLILYGAGMNDGSGHSPANVPILLAGGAAGKLKGGRHIRYPKGTPLANLHLTLLDKLGTPSESFGNSTGPLEPQPLSGV